MNAELFQIGIFPWFMMAATLIFFNPSWPRNILTKIFKRFKSPISSATESAQIFTLTTKQKFITACLSIWVLIHVFLPLRHLLYSGNVNWTEEGHRFSWHMKLRTKKSYAVFTIKDKDTGGKKLINIGDYLTDWQTSKVQGRPYLIWQFCQIIKNDFAKQDKDIAVYVNVKTSLNGRPLKQLISPDFDMTLEPRPIFKKSKWIEKLVE